MLIINSPQPRMNPEPPSPMSRRQLLSGTAALAGAGLIVENATAAGPDEHAGHAAHGGAAPKPASSLPAAARPVVSTGTTEVFSPPGIGYKPVITPNGMTLPWKMVDGVKVFHLIAEPVTHEFIPAVDGHPNLVAECWGYNGRVHGPTIEAVEGDRVRIYVTNKLGAPTSVHWHGMFVPNGMDGVSGLTQKPIEKGETFKYEFTLRQHGTFMYHPHHDEM